MISLLIIGLLALFGNVKDIMADKDSSLQAVTRASGEFSKNFYEVVAKEQEGKNLICSPLSASVVLAMAAYGAGGNTAAQMRAGLHLPSNDEVAKSGFQNLVDVLNNVKGVELRLANKVFVDKRFPLKSSYQALTTTSFRSAVDLVDFSKNVEAANTINSWCAQQTNNRIQNLIPPDSLSSDSALVLVNALYFKGNWKTKFNPSDTHDRPFYVNGVTKKNVPTMYMSASIKYGEIDELNAKFVELPYKNEELSMIIILPDKLDGLPELEKKLKNFDLRRLNDLGYERDVELFLPKFKIESTLELEPALKKLGFADMFSYNANFSGISDVPLQVAKVIQKAFIEVNEEGSEAAAATAVVMMARSMTVRSEIRIDRPFVFGILSRRKGKTPASPIALFKGHIKEP
ncbi:alaserpin isoform X3 [Orussus abietinus]|uniref:alaserpin isoform X3 n=1 Tax=Orussus abietinus TaxID=222816 RepID=UPI0006267858|nr:alaserpin isoform X3 [Orussus abietinus]